MITTIGRWAQAPDLIEPIVGYRAWRYTTSDRGIRLFPVNLTADDVLKKSEWDGAWVAWVTASCLSHVAPDEDCTCGFYATKSVDELAVFVPVIDLQGACSLDDGSDGAVVGRVQLAGKVIEHESGYRAERARIAELIPTTTDEGITHRLASQLGLPVGEIWDTAPILAAMEEAFGVGPIVRPGLLDRWRLRAHRRHLRLILGEGPADDHGGQPPPPADAL